MHHGEELHDEVVARDEVSALVGHDGLELVRGQTVDGALGQHDAAPHAGQAVCRGRRMLEDAGVPVALRREQVDERAVPTAHAAQVAADPVAGLPAPLAAALTYAVSALIVAAPVTLLALAYSGFSAG